MAVDRDCRMRLELATGRLQGVQEDFAGIAAGRGGEHNVRQVVGGIAKYREVRGVVDCDGLKAHLRSRRNRSGLIAREAWRSASGDWAIADRDLCVARGDVCILDVDRD